MNNRQIFLNFYLKYKKNYYNKNVMSIKRRSYYFDFLSLRL